MSSHISRISALSRPRLLVRAARHRMMDFNRDVTLRRLFQGEAVPAPGQAFTSLLDKEEAMNSARCNGGAAYSPARHVEVLAALIHEAQIAELRVAA